jgi:ribosomal protein S18 acetylase RimI-like enzyme
VDVRTATRDDLLDIGRIGHRASYASYADLLDPEAIDAKVHIDYSPGALARHLLKGTCLVCGSEPMRVCGFVVFDRHDDHVHVHAVAVDPHGAPARASRRLLLEIRHHAPELPVSVDVLLGLLSVEDLYTELGFVPGEVVPQRIGGREFVHRRWWAEPLDSSGVAAGR